MPNMTPGKRRKLTIAIVATVAVLATASGVGAFFLNRSGSGEAKPPVEVPIKETLGATAEEAKCGNPERPEYQGYHQIKPGESHPPYGSNPPSSGWFNEDTVPGYYHVPIPPESAMGIAAKGGVVVWTSEKESKDMRFFYTLAHRNDLVGVLDRNLESGVVFVAWGVIVRCERFSGDMLARFIERYSQGKALVVAEPTASYRI